MDSFFIYWHRSIESKWGPLEFWLNQNLLEYVKFEALEFVSIVSPLSELGIIRRFFFVGFLICQGGFF